MKNKNFTDLTGKKAIVTGGAQGLSYGMAEGLMEAGAEVCILDINKNTHEVAKAFESRGYICHSVISNLGEDSSLMQGFTEAVEKLGNHLDILVNGAGVQRRYKSEEFPLEDWAYVININLNAVFKLCQLAGQQYLKQESGGKIINIASMLSYFGGYTVAAYAASKGGVAQLTKALCNEWACKGINVNALAPGYMDTEMNSALTDLSNPRYQEITDRIPAHQWGTPEDMKGPCVFLASSASDYLSGAIIPVDGGYLVR
ncbi:MAG: SDR family oxidoreductase [Clostridiaceae bacterium]